MDLEGKYPLFSHNKVTNQRKITGIHCHSSYELYYLRNGETKYFVGDEIFHLEPGNFIMIPKGVLHKTDSETCLHSERMLISFNDSLIDSETRPLLDELCGCKRISLPVNQLYQVEEILHKLETEFEKHSAFQQIMIRLYILELLTLLCRLKCDSIPHENASDKLIRTVSAYISANYANDLSLKSLSKRFALSEGFLSRKFKAVSGMGINEYITHVRIHNAARLLTASSRCSITEVAAQCGFNDSNYFTSVFKKIKGITPYKFYKMNAAVQANGLLS